MRLFSDFVALCEGLQKLDSDKVKTALITTELAKCSPAERKIWLKLLLISDLPPPAGRPLMEKLVAAMCGLPESELKAMVAKAGHGSFVVEQVWPKASIGQPKPLDVAEMMDLYQNGGIEKQMGRLSGKEVAWLWRLVDRRLAIRLSAKAVLNAVHHDAYEAYKHTGSLDELLDRFVTDNPAPSSSSSSTPTPLAPAPASGISLFTPIKPMLASPCHSVQDLSEQHTRLLRRSNSNGNGSAKSADNISHVSLQVEDKFDGERVQIHYSIDKPAASFSRNLKATVAWKLDALRDTLPLAFPGVKSAIIDGEMLVVNRDTGEQLPFGTLAVHKFAALPPSTSVCVLAFDLLYLDGVSLLLKPLSERRAMLEKALKRVPHRLEVAPARIVKDWGSVESELEVAIERSIEGLIVKERSLPYRPDARHWWKLKRDYLEGMADTVDLLLLGAYPGTGMRGGQLSSFLMGCLKEPPKGEADALAPDAWKTVCRVSSGLSAAQLAELQGPLRGILQPATSAAALPPWLSVSALHRPAFYVSSPLVAPVWEIAGTSVLPSPQHTSGYSVRFPRVLRVRADKDWTTHTSLSHLKTLVAPPPKRAYPSLAHRSQHKRSAHVASMPRIRPKAPLKSATLI